MTLTPIKSPFKVVTAEDKPLKNKWEKEIRDLAKVILADCPTGVCVMFEGQKGDMPYRTLPESYNFTKGISLRFSKLMFDDDFKDPCPVTNAVADPALWGEELQEITEFAVGQCPTSFCAVWEPASGGMRCKTIPDNYSLKKGYSMRLHDAIFTEGTDEEEDDD